MRHAILPGALAAALMLSAGGAAAQSCLGLPTGDGEITLAGTANRLGDDTRYGAEFTGDVSGPAAFGFAYEGAGAEGDRQMFLARASYDFFLLEPAICATAGALFDSGPGGDVDERLGIPVGIGIGKTLPAERFSVTVFAVPQYVWLREKRLITSGDATDTETSNEFMAEAGLTFRFMTFYVGGSALVRTFEDDPGFRLRAGLVF